MVLVQEAGMSRVAVNKVINKSLAMGVLPALGRSSLIRRYETDFPRSEALGRRTGMSKVDRFGISS